MESHETPPPPAQSPELARLAWSEWVHVSRNTTTHLVIGIVLLASAIGGAILTYLMVGATRAILAWGVLAAVGYVELANGLQWRKRQSTMTKPPYAPPL